MTNDPDANSGDGSTQLRPNTPPPRHSPVAERFTPGAVVGGRYRIISLIGEGGMGEVYRADDLKLGQRVALKYVPRALAEEPASMEQLLSEVRIGRQISHPNVCRLYDIVEVDGEHFIAMEFVEGEDLASLLRRIGRLSTDKALAFAIDICSGLAAAHDRGVIHRDLKPANILIDERGAARITDFGLASIAEEMRGRRQIAGTPAYMAPEQLARGEISFRSDLYSLGLVLYEIFTGRRVFGGKTLAEIQDQHAMTKTRPSSVVKDIDPTVERVILQCLEENPAERPPSIRAVIAALPGGDPLQAAIAAGETPSPAMVAAAGRVGDLSVSVAWVLLASAAMLLGGVGIAGTRFRLPAKLGGIKPEPVLEERAREIAGATRAPAPRDTWARWLIDEEYRTWLATEQKQGRAKRGSLPPGRLLFVYRQSPEVLVSSDWNSRITATNPSPTRSGMATVVLDNQGRLVSVRRVPPARFASTTQTQPAGWATFLEASGVDRSTLRPVAPEWTSPVESDQRQAWIGQLPSIPGVPIRIEAASLGGTPVWFSVIGPWQKSDSPRLDSGVGQKVLAGLEIMATAVAAVFARRNILRRRADRRTAGTVFVWIAMLYFVGGLAVADHVTYLVDEWMILQTRAAFALLSAALVWLCYLAVEPYVRRRWPHMLIAWTRLLNGRLRDPMVGRDLLIGGIGGLIVRITWFTVPEFARFDGLQSAVVTGTGYSTHFALLWTIGYNVYLSVLYTFGWIVLLLLFRLILRRPLFAAITLWLAVIPVPVVGVDVPVEVLGSAITAAVFVIILYRFGALAFASSLFFNALGAQFYSVTDIRSILPMATLLAIAIYAFHTSLGEKPAFGALGMEEEPAAT